MRHWLRRVAYWWRSDEQAAALAEEIEIHRALVQARFEAEGLSPREAEVASRRAMGNITLDREEAREVWISAVVDHLRRDLRYGWRGLLRERTFAVTAVLTIALGVATTTTAFSIADAELWRPLPYPDAGQLVAVSSRGPGASARLDVISGAELAAWRAASPAFSELAAEAGMHRQVLSGPIAESVLVSDVTANYFDLFGQTALRGRTFSDGDRADVTGVVMTARAWERLFAEDPNVVGRTLTLDGKPVTVLGIVATDQSLGPAPDFFRAIDREDAPLGAQQEPVFFGATGRLRSGVGAEAARQQVQAAVDRLATERPERWQRHTATVEDLRTFNTGANWRPLYFLLAASSLVLVLSVVNVAALFLGRAIRRSREFALRGALGGGRQAIARQLLVESLLVAAPAGVIGVGVSQWSLKALIAALPSDFLMRGTHIPVDWRAAVVACAITLVAALVCAVMPLRVARRRQLAGWLGTGVRTGRSVSEGRARGMLLTAQMTLTVLLLVSAGIFGKSFVALTQVPLGFDPTDVLAVRLSLSGAAYDADVGKRAYADQVLEQAKAVAGVSSAAIGTSAPLGSGPVANYVDPSRPLPAPGEAPRAIIRAVSPEYFSTLGISLVRGDAFSEADVPEAPRVAIVNATLAGSLFGDDNPVGQEVALLPGARPGWIDQAGPFRIVGVAANTKEVGIDEVEFSGLYVPFAQMPSGSFELIVRGAEASAGMSEHVRLAAARVDPGLPVGRVSTFEARVTEALKGARLNMVLMASFAGVAILLASVGIYGTTAYAVQTREREFGVMAALGARPGTLMASALSEAGRIAASGAVGGVVLALWLARAIGDALFLVPRKHNGILFGVSMSDPLVLAVAAIGVVVVALIAGGIPAWRASRVDPVTALRAE